MSEHTPGPWVAEQRSYGYPHDEGGPIRRLWDVRAPDGTLVMAGSIAQENEGNARLTAASPDLLEAAERLCNEWVLDHGVGLESDFIVSRLMPAIDKARGRR